MAPYLAPPPDWRDWSPGERVMVRLQLPDNATFRYTDVLGTIVSLDDQGLVIQRRSGETVAVRADTIVTGKRVPPPPPRRRPRH